MTPILICIKTNSVRCPNKNYELLPDVLNWCERNNIINQISIISDSSKFKDITCNFDILDYHIENRDDSWDDLVSSYKYCTEKNYESFILLPVTQPLRDETLVRRVLECDLGDCDLVTSYTIIANRNIFELSDDLESFKIQNSIRKGSMCKEMKIADGAIYYTTTKFLDKCFKSGNMNYTFWNSNIEFVENRAPFIDIDTPFDLEKYKKYFKI